MHVLSSPDEKLNEPVALMIGNFDGVHEGHQSIIEQAHTFARRDGLKTAVLSFEPHPLKVLCPEKAPKLLQTPPQKTALLSWRGVDYFIIEHFDHQLAALAPEAFIAHLKERIDFRHILVGFNFRFGQGRKGDTAMLRDLGRQYGFECFVMEARCDADRVISSSRIRELLGEGRTVEAAALLKRPYFIDGVIIHGAGVGKADLETPTANLDPTNECLPRFGVYASWCRVEGAWFRSISNVGVAPTRDGVAPRVETHLFGFTGSLYGKHVVVCLGAFLRDEMRFSDLTALKAQIGSDIETRLALDDHDAPHFPEALVLG